MTVLPVNQSGLVKPDVLKKALTPDTTLVTIMHANNEVGTIQPIKELAAIAHEAGAAFHTDAVQSVGKIPVDVDELGVDMLSASSHKLYGPKGVGCLFIKRSTKIGKYLHGGSQESKMRGGTENVPGIVGFGKAARTAQNRMSEHWAYLTRLGKKLQEDQEKIPIPFYWRPGQ